MFDEQLDQVKPAVPDLADLDVHRLRPPIAGIDHAPDQHMVVFVEGARARIEVVVLGPGHGRAVAEIGLVVVGLELRAVDRLGGGDLEVADCRIGQRHIDIVLLGAGGGHALVGDRHGQGGGLGCERQPGHEQTEPHPSPLIPANAGSQMRKRGDQTSKAGQT